ncbi:DUF4386 family protein [Nostoc sp. B(2019)]|nr:DUF4386 family protein [Nostoc sp. B(2019)]
MNRLQMLKITGLLLTIFAVLINIPYWLLVQNFEYDDILRKPTDYVLTQFHAGGTGLILTWFCFGLLTLLFIPAVILLGKVIVREDTPYLASFTLMGVLSSILQAVGLMRWAFVIPVLATMHVNTTTSDATRAAVAVVYQVVHQYGGVVIGEQLGQTLLICWTFGISLAMLRSPLFKPWVGWLGLATLPFWILGQSELLATVIPTIPKLEVTPIGFMMWEVWLIVIGVFLLRTNKRRLAINQPGLTQR